MRVVWSSICRVYILRTHLVSATFMMGLIVFLSACARQQEQTDLSVAAAASLTTPFSVIGEKFTSETGIDVTFTIASTGHLAQQIRNGAPYDVFAAADAFHIDDLIEEGYLKLNSRTQFAEGRLVLIIQSELPSPVDIPSFISGDDVKRLVIANPEHAPYGLAAKQFLTNTGLWESIQKKLVFSETVRQAAQVVISGNASAGLVAQSTTINVPVQVIEIDHRMYDPILHVAASSENSLVPYEAELFLKYLISRESADILNVYGLIPVGSE